MARPEGTGPREVCFVNPLDFDDTELGAIVRDVYAQGHYGVVFLPERCPTCDRPIATQSNCPACGEEE